MTRKVNFQGISINIEFEKGEEKPDKLHPDDVGFTQFAPYGYIENTISNEPGEELDVFIGEELESEEAFICSLMDLQEPGALLEQKILLGWPNVERATAFIHRQYFSEMIGPIMRITIPDLKDWISTMGVAAEKESKESNQPNLVVQDAVPTTEEQERLTFERSSKSGRVTLSICSKLHPITILTMK